MKFSNGEDHSPYIPTDPPVVGSWCAMLICRKIFSDKLFVWGFSKDPSPPTNPSAPSPNSEVLRNWNQSSNRNYYTQLAYPWQNPRALHFKFSMSADGRLKASLLLERSAQNNLLWLELAFSSRQINYKINISLSIYASVIDNMPL